ncbi:MAG: bis(5'-nucleosyl)-tetraphosphatase (symmetrical) YqeK [Clostridium sp.]|nr:bis(5'-nucleosyl)-tetraphosphatase (symmetrical) YqeK [Clostridium sp.]
MLSINEIKEYLKENLKPSRYEHTLGVAETAKKLAALNGIDESRAEIAGLAHDVAKNLSKEEMLQIIKENNISLSLVEENNINLWHSIIAPIVAENELKIHDEELLEALRWHTTGKEDMSVLVKIIYIADMIEPGRDFNGLDEIRNATFENLDKGVYVGLTHSIKFLLDKDLLIDENTIRARNYLKVHGNFNEK